MKIHLMEPICDSKMIRAAMQALKTERFLKGKSVDEFEGKFATYTGVKYARAVSSGSMALLFSMLALNLKHEDYVLTTPATFIATSNAILFAGAKPLFVDVDLKTYTIDVDKIEEEFKKNGEKIKAIIPVHLYGYPTNMDRIMEIAQRYNAKVIEDACQAHGAIYKNRIVGSIGAAGTFSFYPAKNMMVAGDGGMVTTNDEKIADSIESLRDNGRIKGNPYVFQYIGFTGRMNTVNAAVGKLQIECLEKWNKKRRRIAKIYNKALAGVGDIIIPPKESKDIKPAYHLYVIRTKQRDRLKAYLESKEIEAGIHYPVPIHMQKPYQEMGYKEGMFPDSETHAKEVLSIPMYPTMKSEQIDYVIENIKAFFGGASS